MSSNPPIDVPQRLRKLRRSRLILTALFVIPAALIALGISTAHRLQAVAEHGETVLAHVTRYSTAGNDRFADIAYTVSGKTYTWSVDAKEAADDGTVMLRVLPERPDWPYAGPPLTPGLISSTSRPFVWAGVGIALLLPLGVAIDSKRIRRIIAGEVSARRQPSPRLLGWTFYAFIVCALWMTVFDPKAKHINDRAFGSNYLHLRPDLFAAALLTVLSTPFAIVLPALFTLTFAGAAEQRGQVISGWRLHRFRLQCSRPEIARAANIVLAGLVYFLVLVAIWITYATSLHM